MVPETYTVAPTLMAWLNNAEAGASLVLMTCLSMDRFLLSPLRRCACSRHRRERRSHRPWLRPPGSIGCFGPRAARLGPAPGGRWHADHSFESAGKRRFRVVTDLQCDIGDDAARFA